MDRLAYVLSQIDESLKGFYFKDIIFNGLASLVKKNEQTIPVYYKGSGDNKFVGFDDKHGMNIYYRLISESEDTDTESGFGRNVITGKTYLIKLICFGNQGKILDSNTDINYRIASEISRLIPRLLTKVQKVNIEAQSGQISVTGIEHDKEAVFSIEMPDNDFNLPSQSLLFSIDFNIALNYLDGCQTLSCETETPLIDVSGADCDNLLNVDFGLTESQKLDCILPDYDFNETDTLDSLTTQQVTDLTDNLCQPCPPVSDLTCQELNDGLTQVQRDVIFKLETLNTGEVNVYGANDARAREGRLVDFFTLNCLNRFGNTYRFTDENGEYYADPLNAGSKSVPGAFANEYIIDHYHRTAIYRLPRPLAQWEAAKTDCSTFVVPVLGIGNGFLGNRFDIYELTCDLKTLVRPLTWYPLNMSVAITSQWTISTFRAVTSAYVVTRDATISSFLKTNTRQYLVMFFDS